MRSSSRSYISVGAGQRAAMPALAIAFVLAIIAEFRRAVAAANRYEQARCTMHTCNDPDAGPARRVYLEFYAE